MSQPDLDQIKTLELTLNQLLNQRNYKQALCLLNLIPAKDHRILLLKVQILKEMGQFESAFKIIDQELEQIPYSMVPYEKILFNFLSQNFNCPKFLEKYPPLNKDRLIIYDRLFPTLKCSFTTVEFNAYLQHFPETCVYSTATDLYSLEKRSFEEVKASYLAKYPQSPEKIQRLSARSDFRSKLLYTLFLRNIFEIIELIEKCKTPFIFTLYAGGDYCMNDKRSDSMLRRVTQSPCFRKVIVIECVTRDYLLSKQFVNEEDIEFIYGPITNRDYLLQNQQPKKYYKQDKDTFDICFVAYKHTPLGRDKGYDIFIQVAHNLCKQYHNIRFHVVGNFGPEDIDVTFLDGKINFYGSQPMNFFPQFHASMDIILSPCLPFVLAPGAFDGAPNVSTIEAGLCGVAIFVTDQLKQNTNFKSGEHLAIIPHDAWMISDMVEYYYKNYDELYAMAKRGKEAFERVYSFESQIQPRIKLLGYYLKPF